MRALSKRESNQNPNDQSGPAWGLMQVVEVVRNSWNKRRPGEAISRQQLLDPVTNVRVASDLLNRIVAGYQKHPSKNLKEDWSNPEFVNLVTAGWNSGYSESGGVGKVATFLEANQIPVTHENVFRYASQAGATKHLQNAGKQSWQQTVTQLYLEQPDAVKAGGMLLMAAFAGFIAWGVYKLTR